MENTSCLVLAINDAFPLTRQYPESFEYIHRWVPASFSSLHWPYHQHIRQLANIQDVVSRLKDCQTDPHLSPALSLDEKHTITDCHDAVTLALHELQVGNEDKCVICGSWSEPLDMKYVDPGCSYFARHDNELDGPPSNLGFLFPGLFYSPHRFAYMVEMYTNTVFYW